MSNYKGKLDILSIHGDEYHAYKMKKRSEELTNKNMHKLTKKANIKRIALEALGCLVLGSMVAIIVAGIHFGL